MQTGIVFGLVAAALASPVSAAGTNDYMVRHTKRAITPTAKDIKSLNFGLTFQAGVTRCAAGHTSTYSLLSFEGLKKFSAEDFAKAGFDHRDRQRFQQIAKEEKMHSRAFEGVLGDDATAIWELSNERFKYAYSAIMAVEARHAAYQAELQGQSGFPVPFETALTYSQAYTAIADFIAPGSCGPKKPLPLLQIFPALYTSPDSQIKYSMGLNFTEPAVPANKYYAAFLNAGTAVYEPMKKVTSYEPIKGGSPSIYYLEDSNTVAGPLVAVETD